jgi:uncharacterized protein YlbG (UPF0298 family)
MLPKQSLYLIQYVEMTGINCLVDKLSSFKSRIEICIFVKCKQYLLTYLLHGAESFLKS